MPHMPARLLCLLVLFAASPAMAEGLIGFAYVNNLNGLNLEWAFERNTVYAVSGFHTDDNGIDTEDFRYLVGARHIINDGNTETSGFYTGFMAGDLGGRRQYERLGVGGELGHQWVTEYTRWTLSGGLAVLEEIEERNLDNEPEAFIGFSISLR